MWGGRWYRGRRIVNGQMMRTSNCVYCSRPMVGGAKGSHNTHVRRYSRDHIFPVEWGLVPDPDAINIRICCQECNSLRGNVGHCIGAMACVMAVARTERQGAHLVARRWGMYRAASLITPPHRVRRARIWP